MVYINVNVYERLEYPYPKIWCSKYKLLKKEVSGAVLVKYGVVNTDYSNVLYYGASE